MNTKKILVALVVIAIIAISGYLYFAPKAGMPSDQKTSDQKVGAVSTLDGVDFPFTRIGGLREFNYSQTMSATSSVICSTRIVATSTLRSFTVLGLTNPFSTQLLDVSTSSSPYGSSTPAFVRAFSTGTTGFTLAWLGGTTTNPLTVIGNAPTTGSSDIFIYPGQYVNVRIATSSAGVSDAYMTGRCTGKFQEL